MLSEEGKGKGRERKEANHLSCYCSFLSNVFVIFRELQVRHRPPKSAQKLGRSAQYSYAQYVYRNSIRLQIEFLPLPNGGGLGKRMDCK